SRICHVAGRNAGGDDQRPEPVLGSFDVGALRLFAFRGGTAVCGIPDVVLRRAAVLARIAGPDRAGCVVLARRSGGADSAGPAGVCEAAGDSGGDPEGWAVDGLSFGDRELAGAEPVLSRAAGEPEHLSPDARVGRQRGKLEAAAGAGVVCGAFRRDGEPPAVEQPARYERQGRPAGALV